MCSCKYEDACSIVYIEYLLPLLLPWLKIFSTSSYAFSALKGPVLKCTLIDTHHTLGGPQMLLPLPLLPRSLHGRRGRVSLSLSLALSLSLWTSDAAAADALSLTHSLSLSLSLSADPQMPQPLMDGSIEYEDGTSATMSQMAKDVTVFLVCVYV